ncbi:MAG: S9 family peptidase, partial [Chitinivibrionia bacterium]|nr:S9 family peptidase [Chitinivibrionia bacterium]
SGEARVVFAERDSTWIGLSYMQYFHKHEPRFVWSSERDGFRHLYLYDNDGGLVNRLTAGSWEVLDLNGVDEKKGWIYCTALEKSILEQHLYKVSADGMTMKRITEEEGTHSIRMSEDCRYYMDTWSSAARPSVINVCRNDGARLFTLGETSLEAFEKYDIPVPEFFSFTSEEGISFSCSMLKPSDFDPAKRYPVIVYVYGGPRAQMVTNSWGGSSQLWRAMMASKGYIIFTLDNRGSSGRGKVWENSIARRLGSIELHDQLVGVEYLKGLPYIDASRIGIWGWSYGGSMTCTALFKAPGVFKAGVAVAPVTDFRLYDSIYTERYMDTPAENEEGYAEFNLLDKAKNLQASLLLVHGTTDDNVHMQNSINLVAELIKAGKDFDLMLYPDKEHGISGTDTRRHLFRKITEFFEEKL